MSKRGKIEERLEQFDERLAAAEEYLARGVNVESSSWLHMDDWKGRSGHPLWVKNYMIPATKRARARKERALEAIGRKSKDKGLKQRRRPMVRTR
jgi:hypothetical protein